LPNGVALPRGQSHSAVHFWLNSCSVSPTGAVLIFVRINPPKPYIVTMRAGSHRQPPVSRASMDVLHMAGWYCIVLFRSHSCVVVTTRCSSHFSLDQPSQARQSDSEGWRRQFEGQFEPISNGGLYGNWSRYCQNRLPRLGADPI